VYVEAVDLQYEVEATDPVCVASADGRMAVRNARGGFPPYLYSLGGGGLQSEPAFDGLTAGSYRLRVEESLGCSLEKEAVLVDPPPFGITLGEDRRMYLGDTIRLAVESTEAAVRFQWFPPEGLSCDACPEPLAAPRAPVRYTVSAVSALGCEAEAGVFVDVMLKSLAYAPNAFSPNGDGQNDYFTLYGAADWVQLRSLRIYDRWGALVFERLEPALGSETDGWDGTFQGRALQAGVYVYFAELTGAGGTLEMMNGEVVLLR
jgi:gliding motility-associated-like protein